MGETVTRTISPTLRNRFSSRYTYTHFVGEFLPSALEWPVLKSSGRQSNKCCRCLTVGYRILIFARHSPPPPFVCEVRTRSTGLVKDSNTRTTLKEHNNATKQIPVIPKVKEPTYECYPDSISAALQRPLNTIDLLVFSIQLLTICCVTCGQWPSIANSVQYVSDCTRH